MQVDRDRILRAELKHLVLGKNTQQPGLQRQRHIADFIQQQRAAVRLQNLALRALGLGARECAVGVAEQLTFDQSLRNGCAIQGDERLVAPVAELVDGLRERLLPRTGFTQHQDGNAPVGDLARLLCALPYPAVAEAQAGKSGQSVRVGFARVPRSKFAGALDATNPRRRRGA